MKQISVLFLLTALLLCSCGGPLSDKADSLRQAAAFESGCEKSPGRIFFKRLIIRTMAFGVIFGIRSNYFFR